MRTVDATPFYDLPEAGRLLWADPARLAREAARRAIPAASTADGLLLPKAWVDAEAGLEPADAAALKTYWLARLEPPSLAARRTLRPRARLPLERLLTADEAARALFCDQARLERLVLEGTLPAFKVDGVPGFDPLLVQALEEEADQGPAGGARSAARRAELRAWGEADYVTADPRIVPRPEVRPEAPAEAPPAPRAYTLPDDLVERGPRRTTSDLAKAEGFETVDEE